MSARQALLNLGLRLIAKPLLPRVSDPVLLRVVLDRLAERSFRLPPCTVELPLTLEGIVALSLRSGPVVNPSALVLYLHGGAYIGGSLRTHRAFAARLARLAQVEVILPVYRLAPEHPMPAALEDALAVWDALVARGYAPADIVLAGDSAGGGLALLLLSKLCARGTPPAGLVAFSPWTDLTISGASYHENATRDAMLPVCRITEASALALGDGDPASPDVSPLFADFPAPPPVLIQHSDAEILADDSLSMANRLRGFGAEVTVQSWPAAPHVWQMFYDYLPEARAAMRDAVQAIRWMLGQARAGR